MHLQTIYINVAMRGLAIWRAEMKAIDIQRSISENAIIGNREKITLDADRQNEEKLRKTTIISSYQSYRLGQNILMRLKTY